jgi:hypothetical protein
VHFLHFIHIYILFSCRFVNNGKQHFHYLIYIVILESIVHNIITCYTIDGNFFVLCLISFGFLCTHSFHNKFFFSLSQIIYKNMSLTDLGDSSMGKWNMSLTGGE